MANQFTGSTRLFTFTITQSGLNLGAFASYMNTVVGDFYQPLNEIKFELLRKGGIIDKNFEARHGKRRWRMLSDSTIKWRKWYHKKYGEGRVGTVNNQLDFTGGLRKAATMGYAQRSNKQPSSMPLSSAMFGGRARRVYRSVGDYNSKSSIGSINTHAAINTFGNGGDLDITMTGNDPETISAISALHDGSNRIPARDFWFVSQYEKSKLNTILNSFYRNAMKTVIEKARSARVRNIPIERPIRNEIELLRLVKRGLF